MFFVYLIDRKMVDGLSNFSLDSSTFSFAKPKSISSDLALPKPITSNIFNWLNADDEVVTKEQYEKMRELFLTH